MFETTFRRNDLSEIKYLRMLTLYPQNLSGVVLMDYRERLHAIREDRDLTQAEMGNVLNKSQQGYDHIETGRAELKIEDLIKLCRYYNLSADYIIGLTNEPPNI